jgi:poly(3-hydroxybutyrate) depolymerase
MLYHAYQAHADLMLPARLAARAAVDLLGHLRALDLEPRGWQRQWAAACEVFAHTALTHRRPAFGIGRVASGGREVEVVEEVAHSTPFGDLVRFRKDQPGEQPRVLIAAPMSGHFATLLRDTVRVMLADHEVYLTDWANARDVPLLAGRFGLDEYIEHLIRFLEAMGPGAHLMGVCQPCPAVLAAAALMAEDDHPARPRSITLMAGPVDCRISPTRVNQLANERPIEWFERNLISTVPLRHPGALRRVYPGFLQLTAFMSMNPDRHANAFLGMYNCLVAGELEQAKATQNFYEEYFAVADLPAEFYLETVKLVFQECALACGTLEWRGRRVDPGAIRRTVLLTVEGEKDDICAIGQTMAAQELCTGIRPYLKQHHVQTGVGHYGVFSGRRWAGQIYPLARDAIHVAG